MPRNEIERVDAESTSINSVVMVTVIEYGPENSAAREKIIKRFARAAEQRKT
jgi:hypothetical protein